MQVSEYELNKQIKELEAAIKDQPDSYFVESWQAAIAQLREQAKAAHIAEREALQGKVYNVVLDDWVDAEPKALPIANKQDTVITFNVKTGKYHAFAGKRFIGAYDTMLEAGQALLKRCRECQGDPPIKPAEPQS